MTTTDPTAHVHDLIAAYVAGGLTAGERARFEAHVGRCPACASAAADAARADADLHALFAAGRPGPGFEADVIARFRAEAGEAFKSQQQRAKQKAAGPRGGRVVRLVRPLVHPMVRLAAGGVAAAVVIGAIGYGFQRGLKDGALPFGMSGVGQDAARSAPAGNATSRGSQNELYREGRNASTVLYNEIAPVIDRADPAEMGRRLTEQLVEGVNREKLAATDGPAGDVAGKDLKATPPAARTSGREREVREASEVRLSDGEQSVQRRVDGDKDGMSDYLEREVVAKDYFKSAGDARHAVVRGTTVTKSAESLEKAGASSLSVTTAGVTVPTAGVAFRAPHSGPVAAGGEPLVVLNGTLAQNQAVGGAMVNNGGTATFYAVPALQPGQQLGGQGQGQGQGGGTKEVGQVTRELNGRYEYSDARDKLGAKFGNAGEGGGQAPNNTLGDTAGVYARGWAEDGKKSADDDTKAFRPAEAFEDRAKGTELAKGLKDVAEVAIRQKNQAEEVKSNTAGGRTAVDDESGKVREEQRNAEGEGTKVGAAEGKGDGSAPPGGSTGVPPALTPPTPRTPPASEPATTPPPPPPPPPQRQDDPRPIQRKIIRNGEMTFEVDSFDSAATQVTKIVIEEGGFISTTDSEKLPNGKVKGTVVLRVPPDRLDTLVLKLRGLGDLKSQKINALDVTKRFTDLEGQLRAARAMEERLLDIIKNGKGTVKDLVEAEKQLGGWREKIEGFEGEIRYINNLASLSTLSVTLLEKDVRSPTAAAEVETVQASVETDDVEKGRAEAIKAIDAAKGRIVQAELKQHEAGQLSALIVADVPPDASGPLIDRLRQVGKLARLDIDRKQVTAGGVGPVSPTLKVERKDTRFQISLYNLANIAPRQTSNLNLAAQDVEAAYRAILDQVTAGGGRVVSSQLTRPRPDQTTGTIAFQVPTDKADVLLAAIRAQGDVMRLEVTQNPDTRNATEAKRGFVVQVFALATVAPRESTTLQLAAPDVTDAFHRLLEAAKAGGGRILTSQLNEQDRNNVSAQLDFDVPRDQWGKVEAALRDAGLVVTRSVSRSTDTENTSDSKVRLQVAMFDAAKLQPRETIGLTLATRAVPEAFARLLSLVQEVNGRAVSSQLNQQDRNNVTGQAVIHVPRENWVKAEAALKEVGVTVARSVARAADGPMTVDTKVGLTVAVVDERSIPARESQSMTVVSPDVAARYRGVLDALRANDAEVHESNLTQAANNDMTGRLVFTVTREQLPAIEAALTAKADVFNRAVARSQDQQSTLDTKVRLDVTLKDADRQPPRATYTVAVQVTDVEKAANDVEAAAVAAGGRKVDETRSADGGKQVANVVIDVPLAQAGRLLDEVRRYGTVTMSQRVRHDAVPEGNLSRARMTVTFGTPEALVQPSQGLTSSVREGLATSLRGLLWSLQIIIVGVCLVAPWVLILWLAWRMLRRGRQRPATTRTVTTTTGGPGTTPPMDPPPPPPGGPVVTPA